MATGLSEAKGLYKKGSFAQCKRALLSLHSADPCNMRILQKLGDVCFKLNQSKEAEKHYRLLISYHGNTQDSSVAKSLYEFGRFLLDDSRLDAAAEFLEKCLQIQVSGTAHYHLGLIRDATSDVDGAIHHFQRACHIRPEVVQYHFQLAKCLQSSGRYNEAMKSYERALEISEYKDAVILNEYSQFQYQCMGNKLLAMDFAKLAADLDERFSLKLKLHGNESVTTTPDEEPFKRHNTQCNDVRVFDNDQTVDSVRDIQYSSLKCIMFDFDAAIQYLSLEQHVNGNLHNVDMMLIEDFLIIFGRRDRINRLINHFEKLQSINIRIGLYIPRHDVHYRNLVVAALKRAYLYSYFEFVEDSYSIHEVAKRLELKEDELLLISDRGDYQCPKRFGLSLHDLECIEQNLGFDMKMLTKLETKIPPYFLSKRNFKLYLELRIQILRHHFHESKGVNSLEAIGWIKQSPAESPFLEMWTEFAAKFLFMIYCSHTHRMWTALALLDVLMEVEPDDPELRSMKPVYLANFGRPKAAETAYIEALNPPFIPRVLVDFGFFLFARSRYKEAEDVF